MLLQGAHCKSDVESDADGVVAAPEVVVAAATATQSNLNGMFLVLLQ